MRRAISQESVDADSCHHRRQRRQSQRVAQVAGRDLRSLGTGGRRRGTAGADPIKADIRNPLLVAVASRTGGHPAHPAWRQRQWRREEDFESNVRGAMQLFGACVDAGVQQVVWPSSTAVYGAQPENPLYMPESTPLAARSSYAWLHDTLEVERFIASFAAEYPGTRFAVLRFANIIGVELDSPLTRLLRQPVWPDLWASTRCCKSSTPTTRCAGVPPAARWMAPSTWRRHLPLPTVAASRPTHSPLAGLLGLLMGSLPAGRGCWPGSLEPDYLRYPWIADLSRMQGRQACCLMGAPGSTAPGGGAAVAGYQAAAAGQPPRISLARLASWRGRRRPCAGGRYERAGGPGQAMNDNGWLAIDDGTPPAVTGRFRRRAGHRRPAARSASGERAAGASARG